MPNLDFTGCTAHNLRRDPGCRTCAHLDQLDAEIRRLTRERDWERERRDFSDRCCHDGHTAGEPCCNRKGDDGIGECRACLTRERDEARARLGVAGREGLRWAISEINAMRLHAVTTGGRLALENASNLFRAALAEGKGDDRE